MLFISMYSLVFTQGGVLSLAGTQGRGRPSLLKALTGPGAPGRARPHHSLTFHGSATAPGTF